MPAPRLDDFELLTRLLGVFRRRGYEGASLSDLCAASGLQRASLYHRFPAGKRGMAEAVLDHVGAILQAELFPCLEGGDDPELRLRRLKKVLKDFYEEGRAPCLVDAFSFTTQEPVLQERIQQSVDRWLLALAKLSRDAGFAAPEARKRAERALVTLQGGLVLSRATDGTGPFRRAVADLEAILLES